MYLYYLLSVINIKIEYKYLLTYLQLTQLILMELSEDKLQKIETLLEKERKEWSDNIQKLIRNIGIADRLSAAQVDMLSYRHMITDKIIEFNIMLNKKRSNDSNYTKTRYQYYKTNHDVRLDHREIMEYIKSDEYSEVTPANLRMRKIVFKG